MKEYLKAMICVLCERNSRSGEVMASFQPYRTKNYVIVEEPPNVSQCPVELEDLYPSTRQ
ncbi:hypothetical protein F9C07_2278145 [Aspergillus flavus]|uniref:Uncharacterized protein n=1 Tax=Aspergillus flavus (strain ATCC 200026 / FGSC A1120 / IAM 13836 / NRRL 3357 / JCM 12722 / SRRC 167) TaxID=332952 RepID=A0A7U2MFT9_ASPFN|nr:hypothetical protein F9C07_2278145 [Aspergillus flavus]